MSKSITFTALAPLIVGGVLRALAVTVASGWTTIPDKFDDEHYAHIAGRILSERALTSHHFPVGYPLFLATMLGISGGSFASVRAAQVVLGCCAILLTGRIARELTTPVQGALAAWVVALYLPLIYIGTRVMSETLFVVLLLASLLFWGRWRRCPGWRAAVLGAAFLALSCLVRSNLVVLAVMIPVWQLCQADIASHIRVRHSGLAVGIMAVILALPGIYFYATTGESMWTATNAGKTFYGANNWMAKGDWVSVDQHPELLSNLPEGARSSATQYNAALVKLGSDWIRANPWAFVELLPKKLANAWLPGFQSSTVTGTSTRAQLLLLLSYTPLFILGLVGALARSAMRTGEGPLLLVLVAYTIMSLVFYGNPRLGVIIAPVLCIYTANGLAQLKHWLLRSVRRDRAATPRRT